MVVLNEDLGVASLPHTPLLPGESSKCCESCERREMMSPITRRSGFPRSGGWYARACRKCMRVRKAEVSEEDELARIDTALALERAGVPLPDPGPIPSGGAMKTRKAPMSPAAPWRAWVRARIAEFGSQAAVADHLGVAAKTVLRWLDESEDYILEETVDRILNYDGRWSLQDLYTAPPVAYAAAITLARCSRRLEVVRPLTLQDLCRGDKPGRKARLAMPCSGRGCDEPRADGSLFCAEHAAPLARVRAEFDIDRKAMAKTGGDPQARKRLREQPRAKMGPTCCRVGCFEPRRPGESFCIVCQAEGWEEEGDE